jgi:acetyl esterase/lipase
VLFFHGGGFMNGSADDHGDLCGHLSRLAKARILSLNYRLAPENPFPAAVEDCHAAYAWLIRQGLAPANLALAGISAGGTLALTTLLKAKQAGLPLPAAGLLMSPAPDMRFSGASITANAATDWLTPDRLAAIQKLYLAGHDPDDPLASPVRGDLPGLPPLLVQAGEAELLVDDILALGAALKRAGVQAEVSLWPGMCHSWQIYSRVLAPGREALKQAGDFLAEHLA